MLDVLEKEGYIRGYNRHEPEPGKAEFVIELKYYEGEPVIRTISPRVQAGPPGVFADQGPAEGA